MTWRLTTLLALAAAIAATACLGPRRRGQDTTPPLVKITVLESSPPRTFANDATSQKAGCAKVEKFPTTITLTAADSGGVGAVWLRSLPGKITNVRVEPPPPESQVGISGDLLSVRFARRAGTRVNVSTVITVDIGQASGVQAGATDMAGNAIEVGQVNVRPLDDPTECGVGAPTAP